MRRAAPSHPRLAAASAAQRRAMGQRSWFPSQADSFSRPLRRRRLIICRPVFVAMRARKPSLRFRLMFEGWYRRFIVYPFFRFFLFPQKGAHDDRARPPLSRTSYRPVRRAAAAGSRARRRHRQTTVPMTEGQAASRERRVHRDAAAHPPYRLKTASLMERPSLRTGVFRGSHALRLAVQTR